MQFGQNGRLYPTFNNLKMVNVFSETDLNDVIVFLCCKCSVDLVYKTVGRF